MLSFSWGARAWQSVVQVGRRTRSPGDKRRAGQAGRGDREDREQFWMFIIAVPSRLAVGPVSIVSEESPELRPPKWKETLGTLRTGLKQLSARARGSGRSNLSNADRVASRWSRLASEAYVHDLDRISWSGIPQVHLNHNYLITGSRETYWIEWMRDRFFNRGYAGDALSLGCGRYATRPRI
jgi:hypothetical protein